ncbi:MULTISPECIES: VOC family protein [Glycomyces]|uniref:Catechol 2,3-dioxygenase-like lactoylglutathione lyase family enzyme n=2 Tax=Glycomyces TaxID=58113 RepID=A0A9X3STR0_9ACTN|nr:VOC family protein [Glycomyces lechevalierae]MDA1384705.1 VOC family protein [Glycomyces lechevalierae]MDR7337842.1 catechol 2,3-dioxygenase-like lactoylglutathione lyase family enzyme [Glycomyces lechevalierae]
MIGTWHGLIIDCPDPQALSAFYREVLGMVEVQDDGDWVVIGISADQPGIAFQQAEVYTPSTWPDPAVPQQMHLDVKVGDLDVGEEQVLELGARRLEGGGETFRVFADPAGHPFCLVTM